MKAEAGRVSHARALLAQAVETGLTPAETILLRGELACLAARVARVNARAGREVVTLSRLSRVAKDGLAASQ